MMTAAIAVAVAAAFIGQVIVARNAPRGPIHFCPCGHSMRQRARETRTDFDARVSSHVGACLERSGR